MSGRGNELKERLENPSAKFSQKRGFNDALNGFRRKGLHTNGGNIGWCFKFTSKKKKPVHFAQKKAEEKGGDVDTPL